MKVPDIINGFMVFGKPESDLVQATIECVLVKDGKKAYLSHKCITEVVGDDPFSHPGTHNFVCVKAWNGPHFLRHNVRYRDRKLTYTRHGFAKVSCDEVERNEVSFDEVLSSLKEGKKVNVYMELSFRRDGHDYLLYAPCPFINFPTTNKRFLQPITGFVLYEENDKFFIAYVACYMEKGVTRAIQFKIREKRFHRVEKVDGRCRFFSNDKIQSTK